MSIKSPTALINRFATKELIVTQIPLLIRITGMLYNILQSFYFTVGNSIFWEFSLTIPTLWLFSVILKMWVIQSRRQSSVVLFWWDSVFKVVLLWVGVGLGNLWSLIEKWVFDPGKGHLVLLGIYNYSEMM